MTMWWMPADRSAAPELLTDIGIMQSPESWSPMARPSYSRRWTIRNAAPTSMHCLLMETESHACCSERSSLRSPKLSPNGAWLAYSTNESGQPEVWAMAYPGPGERIPISTNGGTDPLWRRDGRQLFYRLGDQMMVVDISYRPSFTAAKPRVLWKGHYLAGAGSSCGWRGPRLRLRRHAGWRALPDD